MPVRDNLQYNFRGEPYEHLTHVKEHLLELFELWKMGNIDQKSLDFRSMPLKKADLLAMEEMGGFKRDLANAYTLDWGFVSNYPEYPWREVFPTGDSAYRWWQISEMQPRFKLGPYVLVCIETNKRFNAERTLVRTDADSTFELFFAKVDEVAILKKELEHFRNLV